MDGATALLAVTAPVTWPALLILAAPVAAVLGILWRWSVEPRTALYALGRMLLQLLLIGYVLTGIFKSQSPAVVAAVLTVMLSAAAWIAIRTAPRQDWGFYRRALAAIALGGGAVLVIVTQVVLRVEPWFEPRSVIPLGGMIFAASMNAVSLAAERLATELDAGAEFPAARSAAMRAALIPTINSLFAVGLVQIPGFMTGQIIDGADPLIAARYQVMIMAMIFSCSGFSSAGYLWLDQRRR